MLSRYKKIYLICSGIVVLFGLVIFLAYPQFVEFIYSEDHISENFTAVMYLVIFGIALFLALKTRGRPESKIWLLIVILGFLFFGDEIGWGLRILKIVPNRILGIIPDGLHDIFALSLRGERLFLAALSRPQLALVSFFIGVTFAAMAAGVLKRKDEIITFFKTRLKWEPFFFLCLSLAILGTSLFIDEDTIMNFPNKRVFEESMEITGALALLFACLAGLKLLRENLPKEKPAKPI